MRLYIPFYIIALLSFNCKVQFCALKGDVQNLPLRRVGKGEISPLQFPEVNRYAHSLTEILETNS